jgi:hypothetical protein
MIFTIVLAVKLAAVDECNLVVQLRRSLGLIERFSDYVANTVSHHYIAVPFCYYGRGSVLLLSGEEAPLVLFDRRFWSRTQDSQDILS